MGENGHRVSPPLTEECALCLTRQEIFWLLATLEQLPIPSPEGKMLAASIQVKALAVLEAE